MTYTINDVAHIIDPHQTASVVSAIEDYLNKGTIPAFDPCLSCEPNYTRQLIAQIQQAEGRGEWPIKKTAAKAKPKPKLSEGEILEGGYTAGIMSMDEIEDIKKKRPEMFEKPEGK